LRMNILLINPPCRIPDFLPLGMGYIASVLRRDGHSVSILDINAFGYGEKEVEEFIKSTAFDIAGIGGMTPTYKYAKWLAKTIRQHKPQVTIMAGNMVSTAHPQLLLENSDVDIAVVDEGEVTTSQLAAAISSGRGPAGIKGILYKEQGQVVKNPPRERITDLDSIPFPAWDLFPMETYLNNSTQSPSTFGLRKINIFSTRGCPYDCTFCSRPFGRRVYRRSPDNIIEEIRQLKKRYRAEFIYFCDDLFLSDKKWATEVCQRLVSEKLDVKWSASGRVNLVDFELLKKMQRSGCVELGYGFESGSQAVLDGMNKRVTVKQAQEAISATRAAGIRVTGSFIFGMPGETLESINETLGFIKRTRLPIYRFFYATPYPNTRMYEIAREMGRLPEDEDAYVESLGEMRTTFLVNLTDFPDEELVRLKNLTEATAKKNLGLRFKIAQGVENWQRRLGVLRLYFRNNGFMPAVKLIISKLLNGKNKKIL